MKVGSVLGLMFGMAIAGLSHGEGQNTSVSYHLGPSSPLAQAFYKNGALVWDPNKSNYSETVFHGFFPSGTNEGGLLVECTIYLPGRYSGRGRAPDVEDLPGKEWFMGCDIAKKGPGESVEAPVLTLEDLIIAQVAKK